jgi:hypothetical protein
MTPWGLVNCKVFGPQGPSLTNRVSELFTHGSVGGVGRKPGPYPAIHVRPPEANNLMHWILCARAARTQAQ